MQCVQGEPFRLVWPLFADELIGRVAFEGVEAASETVCVEEVGQMAAKLLMVVIADALDVQPSPFPRVDFGPQPP